MALEYEHRPLIGRHSVSPCFHLRKKKNAHIKVYFLNSVADHLGLFLFYCCCCCSRQDRGYAIGRFVILWFISKTAKITRETDDRRTAHVIRRTQRSPRNEKLCYLPLSSATGSEKKQFEKSQLCG